MLGAPVKTEKRGLVVCIRPGNITILTSRQEVAAGGGFPTKVLEGFPVGFDLLRGGDEEPLRHDGYDIYRT